jgi:predicted transcriptional regulator of viral defense system
MRQNLPVYTKYLLTAESKELRVLVYLHGKKENNGSMSVTLTSVANGCSVTKATVNKVFQKLYRTGYLQRVSRGSYILKDIPDVVL